MSEWKRYSDAFGDTRTYWPFFDCLKWRPFAILDLFHVYLDHPRRAFVGLCHCAKFGWNRSSGFDNMPVLMFCEFGLKMPIHALFGWFLGIWSPIWDTILTNLTKVKSTGHSGSSGILRMLVSIVVPEKLPGQKGVTKKQKQKKNKKKQKKTNVNFWAFLTSF